jgi:hypothetical protein
MHARIFRAPVVFAAVALVAGGGGAALAAVAGGSPVDSAGVIHGCYSNGAFRGSHSVVLQDVGTSCPTGRTAISWSQTGPQGPAGAGLTFTNDLTPDGSGPTLENPGTYEVIAEPSPFNNAASAQTGPCGVAATTASANTVFGFNGTWALPEFSSGAFSMTGVVVITANDAPAQLSVTCLNPAGNPLPIDGTDWFVAPVQVTTGTTVATAAAPHSSKP